MGVLLLLLDGWRWITRSTVVDVFFPLHTISESGLDWVAEEWRVVAVGNNNNKRIGERKAPLSTVMQLHNEDMIYVGGHNEMGSSHAYICIPAPQLQDYIRSGG